MKVNFFHVCETAIVDSQTGSVSIIGAFDNINATQFPAVQPQMAVVVGFESDKPGAHDIELIFLDEKQEIMKVQNKINIGSNLRGNWINKISMYPIPNELTHKIKLNFENKEIYSGYITINNK